MTKLLEHATTYPPINCNPALDNSDSAQNPTIVGQKFCGNFSTSTPSSTTIYYSGNSDSTFTINKSSPLYNSLTNQQRNTDADLNFVRVVGTVTFPGKMWSSPNSSMDSNKTITCDTKKFDPSLSNIEYECSGLCPPVYNGVGSITWTPASSVPSSCDVISTSGPNVKLVVDNNGQVAAFSASDAKSIKKICPSSWTMTAQNSSTVDTTANKDCYCRMNTRKSSSQTSKVTPASKSKPAYTTYTTTFSCK